ncbi:hypothetical protein GH714_001344 [Hevea brasiliensis]|uniref:Uncharacterized protein n=1 Tax=Hevea brasiliensis TaxID=3981 RepID=A0A6A6M9W1_HEVBR|nr:hypothetical protein GH714_001344 [Hevea brasiliensis]
MFSSAFLPRSLTHLILTNCNLSDGKFITDLHLPSLRYLVLRDNPLNTISAEIPGLPSLVYLDITQCNNSNVILKVPTSIEERNRIGRSLTRLSCWLRFGSEDISSGREEGFPFYHDFGFRFTESFPQNVVQPGQSDWPHILVKTIIMNNNDWYHMHLEDGPRPRVILQENTPGPSRQTVLDPSLLLWDMRKEKLAKVDKGYMKIGRLLADEEVPIESLLSHQEGGDELGTLDLDELGTLDLEKYLEKYFDEWML